MQNTDRAIKTEKLLKEARDKIDFLQKHHKDSDNKSKKQVSDLKADSKAKERELKNNLEKELKKEKETSLKKEENSKIWHKTEIEKLTLNILERDEMICQKECKIHDLNKNIEDLTEELSDKSKSLDNTNVEKKQLENSIKHLSQTLSSTEETLDKKEKLLGEAETSLVVCRTGVNKNLNKSKHICTV